MRAMSLDEKSEERKSDDICIDAVELLAFCFAVVHAWSAVVANYLLNFDEKNKNENVPAVVVVEDVNLAGMRMWSQVSAVSAATVLALHLVCYRCFQYKSVEE